MKVPKVIRWLDNYLEEAIMVIFLILISCVMMFQIVVRYLFDSPLPWPEEFCRYCFVWSCMLATGFCIRKGSMLRVDVIFGLFPEKIAFILDVFSKVLAAAFCFIMLGAAWNVTMNALNIGQVSPAMQMPTWLLYISAPLGFALGAIRGVQSIVMAVMSVKKKQEKGEAK